jgi:hypothetical protein
MRSSGPRGQAMVFPDVISTRGRLTRRWAASRCPQTYVLLCREGAFFSGGSLGSSVSNQIVEDGT